MTHGTLALTHVAAETQQVAFWLLAVISVSAALGMILVRKAVYCAVLLAVVMLCLAVLYAIEGAPFLAFVQVIVYTGAVLMLFLFVLMIVGIRAKDSIVETLKGQRVAAGLAGIGLLVLLSLTIGHAVLGPAPAETAALRGGQREQHRPADLHHVRVPVRGDQRAADHRRAGRHGAGAPGAHSSPS